MRTQPPSSPKAAAQLPPAVTPQTKSGRALAMIPAPLELLNVTDEGASPGSMMFLSHIILMEAIAIILLVALFVMAMPLFQTRYVYTAITPEHLTSRLVPLNMPNLTKGAIKLWAASSVTEILTIGFGDFNAKLIAQKQRFTPQGWSDFVHAFIDKKIGEQFRRNELVLTTVPAADPVIDSQGPNEDHIYQWVVKVPVIMTYATNNNVTRLEKATVRLTLVRVPYDDVARGVAIDSWQQY